MLAEGAPCVVTVDGQELPGRVMRIFPGSAYVTIKLDACAPEVVKACNVATVDDLDTLQLAKRGLYDLADRSGVAHLELVALVGQHTGKASVDDLDFAEVCRVQEVIYTTRKGHIAPF